MKSGHQRRALATGCDIAAAKVGHHINVRQLGQQGRIVDLDGVARTQRVRRHPLRLVPHGLPVHANGIDPGSVDSIGR